MKLGILSVVFAVVASVAAADPVEGVWKTEVDDGKYAHIKMEACGDAICGTIMKSFDANGEYKSPNQGKLLVRKMKPKGGGKYEGEVWRPSNDKIYFGKIDLNGDSLKLAGCVAGGLICSKQTWQRIN